MNSLSPVTGDKPRYEVLDGLRGVAAMIVVVFHLFETYSGGVDKQIINHGYLAVDFFYVLSGFVIGYAYDDRWPKMTVWNFFKRRLIRLQPMVVAGLVFGAALFYLGDSPYAPEVVRTPWTRLLLVLVIGCFMFPTPPSLDIRGWREITPINGPQWSLMWEYAGNIFYALFVRRLSKTALAVLVVISALMTLDLALDIDVFGILDVRSHVRYTVIGGYGMSSEQIYIGLARLCYPFFCGLLLFRLGRRMTVSHGGFGLCSLILAAALAMPHAGTQSAPWLDGVYNATVIIAVFPLLVLAGAGSKIKSPRTIALCRFLGEISYPLYITHYPLIYIQFGWATRHPEASAGTHIAVAAGIFCISIFVAYAMLRLYDLPVRQWLTRHWCRHNDPTGS